MSIYIPFNINKAKDKTGKNEYRRKTNHFFIRLINIHSFHFFYCV